MAYIIALSGILTLSELPPTAGLAFADGVFCAAQSPDRQDVPDHDANACIDHCILANGQPQTSSLATLTGPPCSVALAIAPTRAWALTPAHDASLTLTGWSSSWSSRAPPMG